MSLCNKCWVALFAVLWVVVGASTCLAGYWTPANNQVFSWEPLNFELGDEPFRALWSEVYALSGQTFPAYPNPVPTPTCSIGDPYYDTNQWDCWRCLDRNPGSGWGTCLHGYLQSFSEGGIVVLITKSYEDEEGQVMPYVVTDPNPAALAGSWTSDPVEQMGVNEITPGLYGVYAGEPFFSNRWMEATNLYRAIVYLGYPRSAYLLGRGDSAVEPANSWMNVFGGETVFAYSYGNLNVPDIPDSQFFGALPSHLSGIFGRMNGRIVPTPFYQAAGYKRVRGAGVAYGDFKTADPTVGTVYDLLMAGGSGSICPAGVGGASSLAPTVTGYGPEGNDPYTNTPVVGQVGVCFDTVVNNYSTPPANLITFAAVHGCSVKVPDIPGQEDIPESQRVKIPTQWSAGGVDGVAWLYRPYIVTPDTCPPDPNGWEIKVQFNYNSAWKVRSVGPGFALDLDKTTPKIEETYGELAPGHTPDVLQYWYLSGP